MLCYIITKENGSAAMYGGALAPDMISTMT